MPAVQSKSGLTLSLFVARIGANDVNATLAAHDLAVFTDPLNASAYLHRYTLSAGWLKPISIAFSRQTSKGQNSAIHVVFPRIRGAPTGLTRILENEPAGAVPGSTEGRLISKLSAIFRLNDIQVWRESGLSTAGPV